MNSGQHEKIEASCKVLLLVLLPADVLEEPGDDHFGEARPGKHDHGGDEHQDQPGDLWSVSKGDVDEPGIDGCLEQHAI